MAQIQNLIFDFGGVLFDIDYRITEKAFTKLLSKDFSFKKAPGLKRSLLQYETGKINTETFIWNIQKHCNEDVQGRDVMKAWNSMLISIPKNRIDFLITLRKKYTVFLLSNINEMHAQFADRYIKKNHKIADWQKQCFDKVYYSHEIQLRKPTKSIYRYILKDARIDASASLFIDDLEENINGAASVGIHAAQHKPQDEIIEKLESYLKTII